MSRTANAVFDAEVDVWRFFQALDELEMVAEGVIANKALDFLLKIELLNNIEYNFGH